MEGVVSAAVIDNKVKQICYGKYRVKQICLVKQICYIYIDRARNYDTCSISVADIVSG